jgi:hypothetical protein
MWAHAVRVCEDGAQGARCCFWNLGRYRGMRRIRIRLLKAGFNLEDGPSRKGKRETEGVFQRLPYNVVVGLFKLQLAIYLHGRDPEEKANIFEDIVCVVYTELTIKGIILWLSLAGH